MASAIDIQRVNEQLAMADFLSVRPARERIAVHTMDLEEGLAMQRAGADVYGDLHAGFVAIYDVPTNRCVVAVCWDGSWSTVTVENHEACQLLDFATLCGVTVEDWR